MLSVRKDSFLPTMSLRYSHPIFSSNIVAESKTSDELHAFHVKSSCYCIGI